MTNKGKEKLVVGEEEKESLREIVETYLKENNCSTRLEGESGVRGLEFVVEGLGYNDDGCRYGDPISLFLADNYGCIDAIYEWIYFHFEDEIRDKLSMEDEETL